MFRRELSSAAGKKWARCEAPPGYRAISERRPRPHRENPMGKAAWGPRKNRSKKPKGKPKQKHKDNAKEKRKETPNGEPEGKPKGKPARKNPRVTLRRRSLVPCGQCRRGHFCRQKNQQPSIAIREMRKIGKVSALTVSGA